MTVICSLTLGLVLLSCFYAKNAAFDNRFTAFHGVFYLSRTGRIVSCPIVQYFLCIKGIDILHRLVIQCQFDAYTRTTDTSLPVTSRKTMTEQYEAETRASAVMGNTISVIYSVRNRSTMLCFSKFLKHRNGISTASDGTAGDVGPGRDVALDRTAAHTASDGCIALYGVAAYAVSDRCIALHRVTVHACKSGSYRAVSALRCQFECCHPSFLNGKK